jgi:hypothetical protein
VEAELGWSLVLLCNAMHESFMDQKMSVQQLLVALSRREDACTQVKAYIRLTKKAQKQFKKINKKTVSDDKNSRVVMLMAEAREITISVPLCPRHSRRLNSSVKRSNCVYWSAVSAILRPGWNFYTED